MNEGIVVQFFKQRGFGFLETADGTNLFFHINHVENQRAPRIGEVLSFEVGTDKQNRPVAINLKKTAVTGAANDQTKT